MIEAPQIPGISNLKEIGRSSLVVGYRGEVAGVAMIVEVLLSDNNENRLEFYRTSALQSRMGHPGMPPVQYSGLHEGRPFRVREFVEGRPVSGLFTDGPLAKERLISTARALASTLSALHRRAMVHTEVHPHCLRVDSSGLIRFTDTGRGWPALRALPPCERSLALPYLAPEVSPGAPARTESDIFSLGAVLAALAAGKPAPPDGVTPAFLREGSKNLPPALRVLLRSMLDKDPAKRPEAQTVSDCLSRMDELNSLLRLKSWKPAASAKTFLGHHAYPLIGREKELGQLMNLWQRASKGTGLSVTILGPKGSGRRRLVEELRRGIQRSGGVAVRHRLEADAEKPTLIVNYSHKGRQGHDPNKPWLSVNFANTGPVPDQHTIELEPLPESDCLRLTEAYLASTANDSLRADIFSLAPMLPATLIQQLDDWCEEGALRPARGRWLFKTHESLAPSRETQRQEPTPRVKEIKLDYDKALNAIVELWATSLEQDDPLVAALTSYCTALKCERVDLYQVVDNKAKYVCASSFGRHRLDPNLMQEVMVKFEPVSSGSTLLFPLRCGVTFCGFMSLQWWDAGAPRFDSKLFQLLAIASSPIALTLGQTQLEDRRLKRITLALEELLQATSEPSDIMQRLCDSLRRSLEFEVLSAWISRGKILDRLFSNPPESSENDGSACIESLFCQPFEPRQQADGENLFLALPLVHDEELLGGVVLSRDPSTGFSETEAAWAAALTRVAESALRNARLFGEQNRLLQQAEESLAVSSESK